MVVNPVYYAGASWYHNSRHDGGKSIDHCDGRISRSNNNREDRNRKSNSANGARYRTQVSRFRHSNANSKSPSQNNEFRDDSCHSDDKFICSNEIM